MTGSANHGADELAARLRARLAAVEARLAAHAASGLAPGLTEPDPPTGERWEAGQVWAHLAEVLPYWMGELRKVVAAGSGEPVPFGRTKADPGRIEAIERDRHEPPAPLMERLRGHIAELHELIEGLHPSEWRARGRHETLGVMDAEEIVGMFMVQHLEDHAAQLDGLAGAAGPS